MHGNTEDEALIVVHDIQRLLGVSDLKFNHETFLKENDRIIDNELFLARKLQARRSVKNFPTPTVKSRQTTRKKTQRYR